MFENVIIGIKNKTLKIPLYSFCCCTSVTEVFYIECYMLSSLKVVLDLPILEVFIFFYVPGKFQNWK